MRQATRLDHEQRLEEAASYLLGHLDETLEPGALADRVCLSRFHFHRVFQVLMGETLGEFVRRLRLERAAHQLRETGTAITEIAFDAGYATHEAFIRAFRTAFGYSPSVFRSRLTYDGRLPTTNGIHFDGDVQRDLRFAAPQGVVTMNIEIRELPTRKAAVMAHQGPYYMIGQTFGRFVAWAGQNGVPFRQGIGIYYDDPETTSADQLHSDAGTFVPDDFTTEDPQVRVIEVPGGTYAVATYVGPYEGLGRAWGELCGQWLPQSGHSYGDGPGLEVYVDDCSTVPPDQLRTELYAPVKSAVPA